MSLKVLPATYSAVDMIALDLSSFTKHEMDELGVDKHYLFNQMVDGVKQYKADVAWDGDTPICMFWAHSAQDELVTYFIATEAYKSVVFAFFKLARRYLAELKMKNPGKRITSYTGSKHPDVEQFFRLMGYRSCGGSQRLQKFQYCSI